MRRALAAPAARLAQIFLVAIAFAAAQACAQTSMLPPQCSGKTGDALDQCVREITPPTRSPHVEKVEQKTDPLQLVNCLLALHADEDFCIARNDAILECRNPKKYKDLDACVAAAMKRLQSPRVADCARADKTQKNACLQRNKFYKECFADPLRYFICLGDKTARK